MRDKITVYGLLSKIYNENKDIFKKIRYDEAIWEYDSNAGDYYSKITSKGLFATYFREMETKVFLQDTVDIIQDNKIEKLKTGKVYNKIDDRLEYLESKIDEIIEVLNEKEN